ncbi:MAG: sporulation transcriptional regulator SpoIIID [Clostridia bacterium]|nr:sporulation transcriptional regulator SpoIIID [Clostridia bacterium]
MRDDLEERVIKEARYVIETGATVRTTAKEFHVGKSTVHKDMTERLKSLDSELYKQVKKVLKTNLLERHLRGGEATKQKYLKQKNR